MPGNPGRSSKRRTTRLVSATAGKNHAAQRTSAPPIISSADLGQTASSRRCCSAPGGAIMQDWLNTLVSPRVGRQTPTSENKVKDGFPWSSIGCSLNSHRVFPYGSLAGSAGAQGQRRAHSALSPGVAPQSPGTDPHYSNGIAMGLFDVACRARGPLARRTLIQAAPSTVHRPSPPLSKPQEAGRILVQPLALSFIFDGQSLNLRDSLPDRLHRPQ